MLRVFLSDMRGWGEISTMRLFPGDTVPLTLTLEDASGLPLGNQSLAVRSEAGNRIDPVAPTTDAHGQAEILISAEVAGEDALIITGRGLSARLALRVTDELPEDEPHAFGALPQGAALAQRDDVLRWERLAGVRLEERDGLLRPSFEPEIKALHGQPVRLQGFILPLENAERQSHFLLSAYPPSCFFCLPGGPETMVEVFCKDPVAFSFDPVLIDGTLEVLEDDDMGLYYRIADARVSGGS